MTYTVDVRRLRHRRRRSPPRDRAGHDRAGPAAAARAGGGRRRVRGRRHLRRRAGPAGHDAQRRHPDRPAPAGRPDRLGLPARVRRDAAADRPDRRPARPGAGAGRGAGGLRRRLAGHRAGLRPALAWSPAASSRAWAAAAWCRRRWRWSPTSTRPSAAASRSGSSPPCRSSAASSGPLFGAVVLALADWRAIFLINLAVGLVLAAAIARLGFGTKPRLRRPEPAVLAHSAPSDAGRRRPARSSRWSPARWSSSGRPSSCSSVDWRGAMFVPVRWATGAGSPRSGWWRSCAALLLVVRCATAARPLVDLRGWAGVLGEADLVGALLPRRRPGRGDPGLRHRGPPGPGLLRPRAAGTSLGAGARRRRVRRAPAPGRGAAGAPRCAAPYAGLGRAAGQLLRRRGPDRRAHRHPDLRPHHRLRRLAAAGRAGAGALPGGPAGRRRGRWLPHPHGRRGRDHRGRHGAGRRRRSC